MPNDDARRFWKNTIDNSFEPLTIYGRNPSLEERAAHAAEYAAGKLSDISAKLDKIVRLLERDRGDS
jgi:hypothetical protein